MLDASAVLAAFKECGITHVVWIPDSELGRWDQALFADPEIELIRVCREGEAIAVAAGLYLGGQQPLVVIQCTGLFEAGDSLRNFLHDLKLPLWFLIGVRSYRAYLQGTTRDSCPVFTEPILQAWQVPYVLFDPSQSSLDILVQTYRQARDEQRVGTVLLAE